MNAEVYDTVRKEVDWIVKHIISFSDLKAITTNKLESHKCEGDRIIVIAVGKASLSMANGATEALKHVDGGVVIAPENISGHVEGLELLRSTHPLPSEKSVLAAEAAIEWAENAGKNDCVLALISGGGSALMEKPIEDLALEDIIITNKILLDAGLSILEINTIRKHLSQVKGGRLAEHVYPARLLGLYASDVPGDRLDLIASGPTVPDPTTFNDALEIVQVNKLASQLPEKVIKVLEKGSRGEIPETPKPGSPIFKKVENKLTASNLDLLRKLERLLSDRGYKTLILTSRIEGESTEVGKAIASIALEAYNRGIPFDSPLAILLGGETSVTVRNPKGLGGRNMELALSVALRIDYWDPTLPPGTIRILAMDTDGIDGKTPSAGAFTFNGISRQKPQELLKALAENNTYPVLRKLGLTIDTGPTGSNLNSIAIVLVGGLR